MDAVDDVARRQMAIVLLDHSGATIINGTPFIAAKLAQVWRSSVRNEMRGVIMAHVTAYRLAHACFP